MYKGAVIADENIAPAFRALGFDAFVASNEAQAHSAWDKIRRGKYGVCFISEDAYNMLSEVWQERDDEELLPIVTIIPGQEGASGTGVAELKTLVEKAIGVDILFKGEEA